MAGQPTDKSQNETSDPKLQMPMELKNLPLILDAKNIDAKKFKESKASTFNLEKLHGPGSGGGGGFCAMNITSATIFIQDHLSAIPFGSPQQASNFSKSIKKVRFLAGANLKVRGQSVNAVNYPSASVIVLDAKACSQLAEDSASGIALLLHEYLGIASIDDRIYQLSTAFTKTTGTVLTAEKDFDMAKYREVAVKGFLAAANDPKSAIAKKIQKIRDESKDGRNQDGAFAGPITRGDIQSVLQSASDLRAPWHYANKKKNVCQVMGSEASFKIFLTWTSNVHYAGALDSVEFTVEVQEELSVKILKNSSDLLCEDIITESGADSFGPIKSSILVRSIE